MNQNTNSSSFSSSDDVRGEHGSGPFKGRGRLDQVVAELQRQVDARVDFVIDSRDVVVAPGENGQPTIKAKDTNAADFIPRAGYPILDQALNQIGGRATEGGIPTRFLRRVWASNPTRTSEFLTGLMNDDPKRRLVRVLDGNVRAYLGQSYRCIDNLDIAKHAVRVARDHGAYPIEASVTDSKMRLRFVSREIVDSLDRVREEQAKGWFAGGLGAPDALRKVAARSWGELPGDTIHPALGFSNSETGHGGCDLDGGILLGACFNLAWVRTMVHEVHVGERLEEGLFTEATARKHADLIYSKVRDASSAYFTQESFTKLVSAYEDAQRSEIRAPSVACRVAISAGDDLREDDLDSLLSYFVEQPGGRTEFNLGQAISRLAQDVEPDRAQGLERFAHTVCAGGLHTPIARAEIKAEVASAS